METYFSDYFSVEPEALEAYGAFNVSLITDLPLFVDPFLLFTSEKAEYQELYEQIIRYLIFLRDRAQPDAINPGLLDAWYRFKEVKQNWFGFTRSGNSGSGLGRDFAVALHQNLHRLFSNFGEEQITKGSHLEKLCLIKEGVGRDNISDFATNLIKEFLCEYTQTFARKYVAAHQRRTVPVPKAAFDYGLETWVTKRFELPWTGSDYVLLTPKDILTKDDTWINKSDLIDDFTALPSAIPDAELREQISNYFKKVLVTRRGKRPTRQEMSEATRSTILEFPQLIDYFIRYKEENGERAVSLSSSKVQQSEDLYIERIKRLQEALAQETEFYSVPGNTYAECHERLAYLKDIIENKGGFRIFYVDGEPIQREEDLQVMYRLVWFGTPSDVSREVNDGRGPADFKVSRGSKEKTIF